MLGDELQGEDWDGASPYDDWLAKTQRQREIVASPEFARRRHIAHGDAMRTAIVEAISQQRLTIAEVARRAGLRSPSALRNFVTHRSSSLATFTAVRVFQVLGLDMASIIGAPSTPATEEIDAIARQFERFGAPAELRQLVTRLRQVASAQAINTAIPLLPLATLDAELLRIKVQVDDAGPREAITLPAELQEPLTGRMSNRDAGRMAFGVRVVGRAAEPAYRAATILVCVPTSDHIPTALAHGRRVLTCVRPASPRRWRRFTVGIRQVEVNGATNRRELLPLGHDAKAIPLELPAEIFNAPWTSRGHDIKVAGVVISAITSEEGPQP